MSLSDKFDKPMSRPVVMAVGTTFVLMRVSLLVSMLMIERARDARVVQSVRTTREVLTHSPYAKASVPDETCGAMPLVAQRPLQTGRTCASW